VGKVIRVSEPETPGRGETLAPSRVRYLSAGTALEHILSCVLCTQKHERRNQACSDSVIHTRFEWLIEEYPRGDPDTECCTEADPHCAQHDDIFPFHPQSSVGVSSRVRESRSWR
jgi:hypothetical protein